MLVKTVSRSEGLLKRLACENHAKGRRNSSNKFNKKPGDVGAFRLPESSDSAWIGFSSCEDAEAVIVVPCHVVDQIDLPGQVFAHRLLAVLAALAW
jgi:hypothetical protein